MLAYQQPIPDLASQVAIANLHIVGEFLKLTQQPHPSRQSAQNHRVDKILLSPCRAYSQNSSPRLQKRPTLLPQLHCSPNSKPYPHLSPLQPKQNNYSVHQRQQRHWPKKVVKRSNLRCPSIQMMPYLVKMPATKLGAP